MNKTEEMLCELDEFFQDSVTEKIRAMNAMMNAFVAEGDDYEDKNYFPNTIYEATRTIEFMVSMKEKWDKYKVNSELPRAAG